MHTYIPKHCEGTPRILTRNNDTFLLRTCRGYIMGTMIGIRYPTLNILHVVAAGRDLGQYSKPRTLKRGDFCESHGGFASILATPINHASSTSNLLTRSSGPQPSTLNLVDNSFPFLAGALDLPSSITPT